MASGKAIGATLVLGGGGATAGAAMGGAFSSKSEEQTQDKVTDKTSEQQTTVTSEPTPEVFTSTLDTVYSSSILSLTKQDNLQFIVKPVSTGDKLEPTKKWWDWAFTNKFQANKDNTTLEAPFNAVNTGYGTTSNALSQACDTAYKKQKEDYEAVFTGTSKLLENIKKFCTKTLEGHDVSEPKSTLYSAAKQTSEAAYALGILTDAESAKKLVDATSSSTNNDLWFKWAFEKRVKDTKAKASSTFSSVSDGTTLKTACDAAYKKNRHELTDVEATGKNSVLKDLGQYCAAVPVDNLTAPNTVPTSEPESIELFQSTDAFTEPENTIYKNKIIDIIKKENLAKVVKAHHNNNRTWWDWAFSTKYHAEPKKTANKGKLDDLFKHITTGYSATPAETGANETALNQACNEAYKKDKGEYKFGTSDFLLKNIGQFCLKGSDEIDISEPQPTFMTEDEIGGTGYKDGIFKGDEGKKNRTLLVKATGGNNDLWWKWAYIHLYTTEKTSSTSTDFTRGTAVKSDYAPNPTGGTPSGDNAKALNQVCDAAYKKGISTLSPSGSNPTIFDDVEKFCKYGSTALTKPAS